MKKRRFVLDKEVLTSNGGQSLEGAGTPKIVIESISLVLSVVSALEPGFCDCLDTDSCPTDEATCPASCAGTCQLSVCRLCFTEGAC